MADTPEAAGSEKPKRRKTLMMGGAVLGVMAIEAAVVVVLVKSFSSTPKTAEAAGMAGLNPAEGAKKIKDVEVKIVQVRARNDRSAEPIIYDMTLYASVSEDKGEEFKKLIESRQATIQDRMTRIIRASDPQRFLEPDLTTLREKFKYELGRIAEDEKIVKEVLIPSIVPYRE